MINVSEEKSKVAKMRQTVSDINEECTKLTNSMKHTSELLQGDKIDDSINELINHSKTIDTEASSLGDQVESIDSVIDAIYAEELALQKQLEEENEETDDNEIEDNYD